MAEKYLKMALQIEPDRCSDNGSLWRRTLDVRKKIASKLFLEKVLNSDDAEDINKSEVKIKF